MRVARPLSAVKGTTPVVLLCRRRQQPIRDNHTCERARVQRAPNANSSSRRHEGQRRHANENMKGRKKRNKSGVDIARHGSRRQRTWLPAKVVLLQLGGEQPTDFKPRAPVRQPSISRGAKRVTEPLFIPF
ncbi:hypothetical protein MRX96_027109 [Rhipicephalus microplus]